MKALTIYQRERQDHGTATVEIVAGDVAQADYVKTVHFYGALPVVEAHALLTKTLNLAARASGEVHGGYTVEVTLRKLRADDTPF